MRCALLFCVVVVGAFQASPAFSFSGSWNINGPTLSSISLSSSNGSCNAGSSGFYYQRVNHTFSTAGVRTINSFGINFIGVAKASSQFDLANLCNNNSVFPLFQDSVRRGMSSSAHWFEGNEIYTIIVGSTLSRMYGAEFWDGTQGQTAFNDGQNQMNRTWLPLVGPVGACSKSSALSLYDTQVVSVNSSGYWNVFLGFTRTPANEHQFPLGGASVSVLRGDVNATDLSTATCASVAFVAAFQSNSLTAQGFSLWLDANQNYTFVVSGGYLSGESSFHGPYGLTVSPARRVTFGPSILTFQPPDRSSCQPAQTCVTDASFTPAAPLPYGITSFQVPTNSFFYLDATQNQDASGAYAIRDLAFFLYNGQNPSAETCGGALSTCNEYGDVFDGITVASGVVRSGWTIIAQAWYDSATFGSDASFDLYIISGPSLDLNTQANSVAPTAAPTTSAAPSSVAPTPSSVAPTPSSVAPTAATRTPTSANSSQVSNSTKAPTQSKVNSSPLFNPGMASLCAVAGFLWM